MRNQQRKRKKALANLQKRVPATERLAQLAAEAQRGYEQDLQALIEIIRVSRRRIRRLRSRIRSLARMLRPWVDAGMPDDPRRLDAAHEYLRMVQDLRDCQIADNYGCRTLRELGERVP